MTEINNITKLEIKINYLERLKAELEKGKGVNNQLLTEILQPINETLNEVRNCLVEEQIERVETRKRIDGLLELVEKMADNQLNDKLKEIISEYRDKGVERIKLKIPQEELLNAGDYGTDEEWIKRWNERAKETNLNLNEKYKEQLLNHVKKHYILEKKGEHVKSISCWLGKNPTGRLFKTKATILGLGEDIKTLANDMWEFLFTPKGEQIIKKEHGRK